MKKTQKQKHDCDGTKAVESGKKPVKKGWTILKTVITAVRFAKRYGPSVIRTVNKICKG